MSNGLINRLVREALASSRKSALILGPRQVGKSTLVSSLKPDLTVNLADQSEFLTHSASPEEIKIRIETEKRKTVFIDEIQRIPSMLNTIQYLIDRDKKLKFYLTGSSARTLKRGGANLLPGRVINYHLGSLVAGELNYKLDTAKALTLGTLPEIYTVGKKEAIDIVSSYSANYIQEEIKAEALTRNLESFVRFFKTAILAAGQFIDFTKVSQKAKISRHAVPRYFEILEDTLVGHLLTPFSELSEKKDLIRHPKFYLFDNGVYNGLLGNFVASADRAGVLAEQLVFSQLLHSAWAHQRRINISTFRTRKGVEVDFIVELDGDIFAIEVKTSGEISSDDLDGLIEFKESFKKAKGLFVFHMSNQVSHRGSIHILPWQLGLKAIGL